jgi:hypothetical protein
MQIPFPNFSDMTSDKFIMWIAAGLLIFVLWSTGDKLDAMQDEHKQLLKIDQVICYNHAENNPKPDLRSKQQQRCLDMTLDLDKK